MNAIEWLQVGAGVFALASIVVAFVRWSRKLDAIFPEAARHYGLAFTQDKQGSAFTNVRQSRKLLGAVRGKPLQVVSTYETRGRLRMRGTWIATRAPSGLPACAINISRRPPAADVHLVSSGNARFDAQRWITSDAGAVAQALFAPSVREAVLRCPQDEIRLVVQGEQLVLSFPDTPSNQAELHGPIDVVLAITENDAP